MLWSEIWLGDVHEPNPRGCLGPRPSTAPVYFTGHVPFSRSKPWRPNEGGRALSLEDAEELLDSFDVGVPDDVRIVITDFGIPVQACAAYGGFVSTLTYTWDSLLAKDKVPVRVRPCVFRSDEAVLSVLSHELFEVGGLRARFAGNASLTGAAVMRLIHTDGSGPLHNQARSHGDELVTKLRVDRETR